jgi:hypothetical protein
LALRNSGFEWIAFMAPPNDVINVGRNRRYRIALMGQFTEGIDEVRHLIRCGLNLLIDFVSAELERVRFVREFGVGNDGGEVMTQVVRYRTCSTRKGCDPFRLNPLSLLSEELAAHLYKRST